METDASAQSYGLRILVLEDSARDFELISEQLNDAGFTLQISWVETEDAFTAALRENPYDIILSDFKLPGFDAFGALRISNAICPEVPFICVSGTIGEETAIELLKLGAVDYVLKDRPERLPFAVKRAIDEAKEKKLHKKVQEELLLNYALLRIAGTTAKLGGWSVDLATNIPAWSEVVADIHEMPHDYVLGVNEAITFYAPEWQDRITRVFTDCAEKGIPYDEEMEIITRTGRRVWVRTTGEAVKNEEGKVFKVQGSFQDITGRKMAEKKLKVLEQQSRAWLENSPACTKVVDLDFNLQFMSRAGITGLKIDDITPYYGKPYPFHFYPVSFNTKMTENMNKAKETGEVITQEAFVFDIKGNVVWFHSTIVPVKDDNGRIEYLVIVSLDTTERKQAEQARRESEEKFRTLVTNLSAGVVVHAPDSSIIFSNSMASTLLGLSRDQMRGKEARDLAWCFLRENETAMPLTEYPVNRVLSSGEPIVNQVLGICRPDLVDPVWVQCNAYPDTAEDGTLLEVIVTFSDITGRKQSLHALQEANTKIQASQKATLNILEDLRAEIQARMLQEAELKKVSMAIEQVGEIIIITDPAAKIEYVNPAFATVSGYTSEEVIGKTPAILKSGQQDNAFYQNMWATITGGQVWHGRMVNKRKDGNLYTEEASISPVFDAAGKIINYVGVKRDITAELALAEQFQQAQKMESVGRLAGGVAHDYNNMLSVILGYTEMALDKVAPSDPLHDDLRQVYDAARRSTDITRQLLAFARKQVIAPVVLDLNTTVDGMLNMLRRLIGENISLAWLPAFKVWPVKIDPSQLVQILANLCVNGRDAIDGVGKVTIETANVILDDAYCARNVGSTPGAFVMLAVSDSGCGMDKNTLEQIFEPFFTTKELGKGTGLGLATVYGIVKQNRGFINVYSEPGHGTTFKIFIPRNTTDIVETKDSRVAETLLSRGETILLVEDESTLLVMAKRLLESLSYSVLSAAGPGDALRIAEEHIGEIHLLLTDVIMPEMNGRDLAHRLAALYPSMKILFMSGYTADVITHQGVLDEGVHFIQKPLSQKDLAAKMREVLDT